MVELSLTKRQQEIFEFIKSYSSQHGYPPTVRDIGRAIGLDVLFHGARAPGEPGEARAAQARPHEAARDRGARR